MKTLKESRGLESKLVMGENRQTQFMPLQRVRVRTELVDRRRNFLKPAVYLYISYVSSLEVTLLKEKVQYTVALGLDTAV